MSTDTSIPGNNPTEQPTSSGPVTSESSERPRKALNGKTHPKVPPEGEKAASGPDSTAGGASEAEAEDQRRFLDVMVEGLPEGSYFLIAERLEWIDKATGKLKEAFPAEAWREQLLVGSHYFSTGCNRKSNRRWRDDMVAFRAIILDDIGTKIPVERVTVEPTWKLETSAGNFQYGYLMKVWDKRIEMADELMEALCDAGLQDPAVNRACRLFRIPGSVNTKKDRGGFVAKLHTFVPERTFTLTALAREFKVVPKKRDKAEPGSKGSRPAPTTDRIFDWLADSGLLGSYKGAGCWHIECPWPGEHSDDRSDAWVMPATAPESENHRFNVSCWHGHGRDDPSGYRKRFLSWIIENGGPSEHDTVAFQAMLGKIKAQIAADEAAGIPNPFDVKPATPPAPAALAGREKWDFTDFTDSGNTALLKTLTDGGMRYVPELKLWIFWTPKNHWVRDDDGTRFEEAMLQMARLYVEQGEAALAAAAQIAGKDERDKAVKAAMKIVAWGHQCRDRKRMAAMREQARVYPGLPISAAALDTHRHLLGVANGVVDLRTGELKPDARDDYVTLRCPYAYKPEAECPRWLQFIRETSGLQDGTRRTALEQYHQIRAGYAFTGEVREQKFFNDFGRGSNGKNIMHDQYAHTLGSYSYEMPAGAFVKTYNQRDANAPSPAMHGLMHKRFATASEWEKGKQVDMIMLLRATGNEVLTTRDTYGKNVTTPITAKLFFPSNDPLETGGGVSDALKGRAHVVPFSKKWNRPDEVDRDPALPDGDRTLKATLREESEGILAWAVQGAVLYYRQGLTLPDEVAEATRSYVRKQNPFVEWFGSVTILDDDFDKTTAPNFETVYGHYVEHCRASGAGPANEKAFSMLLAGKSVPRAEVGQGKGRMRYGILLHKKEATTGRSEPRRPI